jgi:transcriptional regulator with XRE-family HTH domain
MRDESVQDLLMNAIRERRQVLDISQSEAATAAGISLASWNKLENGRMPGAISRPTKRGVAQALGWTSDSVDRLLRGEGPVLVESGSSTSTSFNIDDRLAKLPKEKQASARAIVDAVLASIEAENA